MVLYFDEETQNDFCREIEKYVEEWSVSYIDAVVTLCESKDIPIESMAKVLSKPILEKIQQEGENLNFLPKSSKLPI
jgi:vacuolar-type H+-ATPase subunit B/Vma2